LTWDDEDEGGEEEEEEEEEEFTPSSESMLTEADLTYSHAS
jgi:hypothetical protein